MWPLQHRPVRCWNSGVHWPACFQALCFWPSPAGCVTLCLLLCLVSLKTVIFWMALMMVLWGKRLEGNELLEG